MITNEIFIDLIKFEVLCGQEASQNDFRRLRAAAVLSYCAGLWLTEIEALRRRDWLPDGVAAMTIKSDSPHRARTVPASPAVIWAVRQLTYSRPGTGWADLRRRDVDQERHPTCPEAAG